eukprot:scaffold69491_cov72-Phaeocystis_antarctica.AAC.2
MLSWPPPMPSSWCLTLPGADRQTDRQRNARPKPPTTELVTPLADRIRTDAQPLEVCVCTHEHPISGRGKRQRRLAKHLGQRFRQPPSGVPSDPLLPRAAITVAKGAQRSLEQWKEKLDGVQVRFHGFAIALFAPAALSDELRRHLQHASAQLQRELGVGRPGCWRLAFSHLPELIMVPICAGLDEQVNHVARLLCSLLCHCVVIYEREEPLKALVAAICCHLLHKCRLGITRRSKRRQSFGLLLAGAQGVSKLLRAATPLEVIQRKGHWELLKQDHGHHLRCVHEQSLLARLGKVDEPQRVAHVDQDIAAVEVAVLVSAEGLVLCQPGLI